MRREREREREREIHVLDPGLYSNLGLSFSRVCTLDFKHKDKRKMEENSFSVLLDNEFKNNKRKRRHKGKVRGREERGEEREVEREAKKKKIVGFAKTYMRIDCEVERECLRRYSI